VLIASFFEIRTFFFIVTPQKKHPWQSAASMAYKDKETRNQKDRDDRSKKRVTAAAEAERKEKRNQQQRDRRALKKSAMASSPTSKASTTPCRGLLELTGDANDLLVACSMKALESITTISNNMATVSNNMATASNNMAGHILTISQQTQEGINLNLERLRRSSEQQPDQVHHEELEGIDLPPPATPAHPVANSANE
jgi:hypothetical protein